MNFFHFSLLLSVGRMHKKYRHTNWILKCKHLEYRRNLFFIYPHWPGSTYITPSFEGSRTGALIAASFAILTSMGKEFYAKNAKAIHDAVIKVKNFIRKETNTTYEEIIKQIGI